MKIEVKVLKDFLEKIAMKDDQSLDQVLLRFEKDGLKVGGMNITNICMTDGVLPMSKFSEYEEVGVIGTDDLSGLIKALKRLNGEAELKVEGNLLIVNSVDGKRTIELELTSEQFIKNEYKVPDLGITEYFEVDIKELKEVFDDAVSVRESSIIIEGADGKVLFTTTGKFKFKTEFDAPNVKEPFKAKYGQAVVSAMKSLTEGNIKLGVKTDFPLHAIYEADGERIQFVIAPRVETE